MTKIKGAITDARKYLHKAHKIWPTNKGFEQALVKLDALIESVPDAPDIGQIDGLTEYRNKMAGLLHEAMEKSDDR